VHPYASPLIFCAPLCKILTTRLGTILYFSFHAELRLVVLLAVRVQSFEVRFILVHLAGVVSPVGDS